MIVPNADIKVVQGPYGPEFLPEGGQSLPLTLPVRMGENGEYGTMEFKQHHVVFHYPDGQDVELTPEQFIEWAQEHGDADAPEGDSPS